MGPDLWRCKALPQLFYACIALQALLCWSCGYAQRPGFLSIACGSSSTTFTDEYEIEWISDAHLMSEGEPITIGHYNSSTPYSTMRVFKGKQSKYCYNLTNSAVIEGAFFLLRASFFKGSVQPYQPHSSDAHFRFKLLIDADVWWDVDIKNTDTDSYTFYEAYIRALRSSISVCLARSTPEGDDPFISALELRPLPASLSATLLMNNISRSFIRVNHWDYGSKTSNNLRYPLDSFDRLWLSSNNTPVLWTTSPIDTSKDQDMLPASVLQTSFGGNPDSSRYISLYFSDRDVNGEYHCVIYFAEIDPEVNAIGQREFNILLNGETEVNLKPIDVFAEVGAYAPYEIVVPGPIQPNDQGYIFFNFSATTTSLLPPFFAAAELFQASNNTFSAGSSPTDVSAIEDLKTNMNLSSYSGDPCLPKGFELSWLTCVVDDSSKNFPRIISIDLSNYLTGGKIPETINTLYMLEKILLGGNNLVGSIPNMSALASLETLDLSNNSLSGSIPESLGTLENLKVLNLENNNLTGAIPPTLLKKQIASTLDFKISGNPLCETNSGAPCTFSSSISSSKPKINKTALIIGVILATFFVVSISIISCLCKKSNQTTLKDPFHKEHLAQQELPLCHRSIPTPAINRSLPILSLQEFTFQDIKLATQNFSTELGKGGFGPVYKGNLEDGRIVALKVASNSSQQGMKEFFNEVDQLSRVHHKNLVGLLGYCKEENLVLVYEFMSNGSLFDCLHGPIAKPSTLSWYTRLKILIDAAQGIDYLHYGCNPQIIHRDIKSSNILLNDKLEAKISDFGISRNIFVTESGAPPTTLMGSMGYLDPEYFSTMILTEKVDVYSFGVVILEVLCGKTAIFAHESKHHTHIVEWIKPYIDHGIIDDIVDPTLYKQYDVSSVWRVLEVALGCVELSSAKRPRMSTVYTELKEAMQMELESGQRNVFDKPSIESDYNCFSITHVQAR